MKRVTPCVAACAALAVASTAHAQPALRCENGEVVVNDGDLVELRINPNRATVVQFAGPIESDDRPEWPDLEVSRDDDRLVIHPRSLPRGTDELGSFPVSTAAGMVTLELRAATTPAEADTRCQVIPRTHREFNASMRKVAAEVCAADLAGKVREVELWKQKFASASVETLSQVMLSEEIRIPIEDPAPATGLGVHISAAEWVIRKEGTFVLFDFYNRESTPYPVAAIQLLGTGDYRDHAADADLNTSSQPDVLHGVIPGGGAARGFIRVSLPERLPDQLQIQISQPGGLRPIRGRIIPSPGAAQRQVVIEEQEVLSPRKAVQGQAVGGVVWIGGGQTVRGRLAPTGLQGLGARFLYDFDRRFGFESDVAIAFIDSAHFSDVVVESSTGELLRSGTLGRVGFGGVLRLGRDIASTFRLGVGAQGVGYRSEFALDDGRRQAIDDDFQFTPFLRYGVGVRVLLGDFVSSLDLSAITPMVEGGERGIEFGLQFGYSWPSDTN